MGHLRFGYASQNLTLEATTGRTLRLANLHDADKVRTIVTANLADLETIVRWNADRDIGLFRIGQQLVPFASHPQFPYDWEAEHGDEVRRVGAVARALGVRLSVHPGQFIQPGSPKEGVVQQSLAELRYVARLLSLLGNPDSTLVLHLGGAYGDKEKALRDFVCGLEGHTEILQFLALENDERTWTVEEAVVAAEALRVPAIVDTLHHSLNGGSLSLQEALDRAFPTWPARPKVHLSSQDHSKQQGAHAEFILESDFRTLYDALNGRGTDIMVEAKGKERAVLSVLSFCSQLGTDDSARIVQPANIPEGVCHGCRTNADGVPLL